MRKIFKIQKSIEDCKMKRNNFRKILLLMICMFLVSGCKGETLKLKKENFEIEYGQKISEDVNVYLDNTEKFLKDVKIENIPENESEKEYPSIGQYELILKKDKEEQKVKVSVKDTVAPTFTDVKDSYEVKYGDKFDVNSIKVEDLSKVELSLDGDVDYNKAGTYKVNVVAKDESSNETTKEISIVVKEEEKKETSSSSNTVVSSTEKSNSSNSNRTNSNSSSETSSANKNSGNSSSSNSNSASSSSIKNEQKTPEKKPNSIVDSLNVAKNYSKIFIVTSKSYSSRQGTFTFYNKVNGEWKKEFTTTCDLGKSGIGTASENAKTTPVGKFTFTKLMGLNSNPGTKLNYHQIDNNDYWCGETYYNQFIDEDVQEHNCSKKNDEHLSGYPSQYKYAAAFNYNSGNVKGKGFAYFLHCSNNIHYTGGCVAIPTNYMKKVMQEIDGSTVMLIDLEKNISKY